MENAYRLFCLITMWSCFLFCIPSNAELNTLSAILGNEVNLFCKNESLGSLSLLTWTKSKTKLVTYASQTLIDWHPEVYSLQINMSLSEAKLYALIIEEALWHHAGNYTCETTTGSGVWKEQWILNIIDKEEAQHKSPMLIIIITAICVGVIFIACLTILLKHLKQRNNIQPVAAETEQDIYENCLESQRNQSHHIYSN